MRWIGRIVAISVSLGVALETPAAGQARPETSYGPGPGSFSVATAELPQLVDAERGTSLPVRIHYPVGNGSFPVIVFSHSLNGNKDVYGEIARHWASHGFVSIHPTHDDTGVRMGPAGVLPPPEKVINRVRDVVAILDGLDQVEREVPALRGRLDRSGFGVAGHSYGSFITLLVGGVRARVGSDEHRSFADPRVRCIVPIAPAGRGDYGLGEGSWTSLDRPALFINGTADIRAGQAADWRLEPFEFSPSGDKFQIVIEGAAHGDYGGDRAETDAPEYVKVASTAFWEFCLRGSVPARAFLSGEGGFRRFAGVGARVMAK